MDLSLIKKTFGLSKEDFKDALQTEVKKRATGRMLDCVVQEVEYSMGKINQHETQMKLSEARIAIYERRVEAIQNGAFTIDTMRGVRGGIFYDASDLNDPNY